MASHKQSGSSQLTPELVIRIRQLAKERLPNGKAAYSSHDIAERLEIWTGIQFSTEGIRRVIRRDTWRHVPDVPTVEEAKAAMAPEIPLEEKMRIEASAQRMWKLQQEMRGQRVLDELTGETTPPPTKENEK